jgi:hypothetical protein
MHPPTLPEHVIRQRNRPVQTATLMSGYLQARRGRVVVVLQQFGSSQPRTKKAI